MRIVKRFLAFALMIVILTSSIANIPASAATNSDFYHFPLVTKSMGGGYMSAAVAIQKFLLLYSPITYSRISSNGGTDGYFGEASASAASYFQGQEKLDADGKVGSLTWMKICELLNYVGGIDSDASYYFLKNNSGVSISSTKVIIEGTSGYKSVTQDGTAKEVFYYYT